MSNVNKQGERRCSDCRYMNRDRNPLNPLELLDVCHLGPPHATTLPTRDAKGNPSIGFFASHPVVQPTDWCYQFEPDSEES